MGFKQVLAVAVAYGSFAAAQMASNYCDPVSGICYQGYTDKKNSVSFGVVLPPIANPPADEYIAQIVAPLTYGWTGLSMGGSMENSLLFVLWSNGQNQMLNTRWTSSTNAPQSYPGPFVTLLPDSTINSTHVKATFRCQNCTVWRGGSLGSGDLNGFQFIAYAFTKSAKPSIPSSGNSDIPMHDAYGYFALNLASAHSSQYYSWLPGGSTSSSGTTTPPPPPPPPTTTTSSTPPPPPPPPTTTSSTPPPPPPPPPTTTTSSTPPPPPPPPTTTTTTTLAPPPSPTCPGPISDPVGPEPAGPWAQCGGVCWGGPFTCQSGYTCMYSNSWYSQCLPGTNAPPNTTTTTTTVAPDPTPTCPGPIPGPAGPEPAAPLGQCGGACWGGPFTCQSGYFCMVLNPWYSQCELGISPTTTTPNNSTSPPTTLPPTTSPPTTTPLPPPTTSPCTTKPVSAPAEPAAPHGQCGGICYFGPFTCPSGWKCVAQNQGYSQCLPVTTSISTTTQPPTTKPPTTNPPGTTPAPPATTPQSQWGQCGGIGWTGATICSTGLSCQRQNDWYSQCLATAAFVLPTSTTARVVIATITPFPNAAQVILA